MGGGPCTAARHIELGKSQQSVVKLMMPLYFDPIDCTVEEHRLAEDCWNLVLTDKAPMFLEKKGTDGFAYASCVTFFYDNFYVRLFDIHPASKELFKSGMKGQGKFLVMMLSLALSELAQPAQFEKSLLRLADIHYKRGVKAVECKNFCFLVIVALMLRLDAVVGDVLFWTLRKVMGEAYYTLELHKVWVKIYSRMLKTLVPAGVALELKGDESTVAKRDVSSMFADRAHSITVASGCPHSDRSASGCPYSGGHADGPCESLESQKIIDSHSLKLLKKTRDLSVQIRPAIAV